MKKKTIINIVSTSTLGFLVVAGASLAASHHKMMNAEAGVFPKTTLPKTNIDLSDNTNDEIKAYYASLNGKAADQLKGENLLKHLKGILQNNAKFYSYDDVDEAYIITDRDWKNSPANTFSNFDGDHTITSLTYSTEINKNPYLKLLYCDYDVQGKTKYQGDGDDGGCVHCKSTSWATNI